MGSHSPPIDFALAGRRSELSKSGKILLDKMVMLAGHSQIPLIEWGTAKRALKIINSHPEGADGHQSNIIRGVSVCDFAQIDEILDCAREGHMVIDQLFKNNPIYISRVLSGSLMPYGTLVSGCFAEVIGIAPEFDFSSSVYWLISCNSKPTPFIWSEAHDFWMAKYFSLELGIYDKE